MSGKRLTANSSLLAVIRSGGEIRLNRMEDSRHLVRMSTFIPKGIVAERYKWGHVAKSSRYPFTKEGLNQALYFAQTGEEMPGSEET